MLLKTWMWQVIMNVFLGTSQELMVLKGSGQQKTKETKNTTEIINLLYGLKCLKIFLNNPL